MASINLLPEQMRERERKEIKRASKKPKIFDVELSRAKKEKPISSIRPPKKSLWKVIFGKKKKPVINQVNGMPVPRQGAKVDFLSASGGKKIKYKPVPRKKNSLRSSIGPARSPIKSINRAIHPVAPREPLPSFKRKKPSLFAKIFGIGNKKPKPPKVKKVEKQKPIAPSPPPPPPPKVKDVPKPKPVKKEKYHSAPKAEKAKFDINLIPEELLQIRYKKSRQKTVTIMMSVLIPALIITGLFVIIDQQQRLIDRNIIQLNDDRDKLNEYFERFENVQKKNIKLQDKLLTINELLQKHIYWTKFFSLLERYTLDDVHYTDFTADTSGQFVLPAVSSLGDEKDVEDRIADGYYKAAQQIVALGQADDFVDSVSVDNLEVVYGDTSGANGIKFELNIGLIDGVFIEEDDSNSIIINTDNLSGEVVVSTSDSNGFFGKNIQFNNNNAISFYLIAIINILILVLVYIYIAISFKLIAEKTNTPHSWWAWVPLLNLFLLVKSAKKTYWFIPLFFIPFINIVVAVIVWMAIAEKLNKQGWIGLLIIVPIVGIFIPGYLAFSE
jgi:hypothetical protein